MMAVGLVRIESLCNEIAIKTETSFKWIAGMADMLSQCH